MNEDYCDCKLSLALKAAGFDEPCDHCYAKTSESEHEFVGMTTSRDYNKPRDGEPPFLSPICSAVPLWHAQKWLREKKEMHCQVLLNGVRSMYFWQVRELVGNGRYADSAHQYDVYEDAMSDCISAALGLIKEGE